MRRTLALSFAALLCACGSSDAGVGGGPPGGQTGAFQGVYFGEVDYTGTCMDGSSGNATFHETWAILQSGAAVNITEDGLCGNMDGNVSGSTATFTAADCDPENPPSNEQLLDGHATLNSDGTLTVFVDLDGDCSVQGTGTLSLKQS